MRRLFSTLALIVLISSPLTHSKETITWVKWKLAPEYIDIGEYAGKGYLDKFLVYVTERMPEYDHDIKFLTLNSLDRAWDLGHTCSLHLWLGYWPQKIIYSNPYGFTPRFGIVTKSDSALALELGVRKSVSLHYLLNNTDYKLGILPFYFRGSENSRYPLLKDIIRPHLMTDKVRQFTNSRNEMSVNYLVNDRADYVVRMRITHYSELVIEDIPDNYRFFLIEEGMNYKKVASACSNTVFGKKVIKRINSFIDDDFYMTYLRLRQEWDNDNVLFEKTYNRYFIDNIPNEKVTN